MNLYLTENYNRTVGLSKLNVQMLHFGKGEQKQQHLQGSLQLKSN